MNGKTSNILIIGGGVAGMSAAQSLADQDIVIHLVEKENALGGHAAMWACMATDVCKNCGACLSIEMADQIHKQKNVVLHLNTRVNAIEKNNHGYTVSLENTETVRAEKIIMTTGFSPFNPLLIPSFHYGDHKNVITTAELNTCLKEETLSSYLNGKSDPKIAFIQCVGSRNREQGRDFCSQVCCKISMRHADKLAHLYPEADITLFYMDLQIIGKEARTLFTTPSSNITLVQGVPAEILENRETNQLTIVAVDKESNSRSTKAYDLIVLSVGMQPSQDLETTAGTLELKPNSWGFFNSDQAVLSKDIIIAGCAKGPKDILASQQDGRIAAGKAMGDLNLKPKGNPPIAVFGEGDEASQTAEIIASNGYPTYLFGKGTGLSKTAAVKVLSDKKIISVSGTAGNFSIFFESGKKKKTLTCAAIITSLEPTRSPSRLNGFSHQPFSLEQLSEQIENTPENCPDTIIFLLDYAGPEVKSSARDALKIAIKVKTLGKNVSIIMNKMLVHGALGQRIYDTARQKGIDFLRFETSDDIDIRSSENGFSIQLKEVTLPSVLLNMECDCLVIPTVLTPGTGFKDAGALLRQPLDAEGFLQSANTRHPLTRSPRKGIFFAGPCHDETDQEDFNDELNDILSALSFRSFELSGMDTGVEINQNDCAQCLTCFRICPHSAIILNQKDNPEIVPDACFSCHLCVANCPASAIESKEQTTDQIAGKAQKNTVAVLACERSAALAAMSLSLPESISLIPIPCACRISSEVIFKTLLNGASKVIISGCHQENCRSLEGSSVADATVQKVLSLPGMDASKVVWKPVAANETTKFARIISKA